MRVLDGMGTGDGNQGKGLANPPELQHVGLAEWGVLKGALANGRDDRGREGGNVRDGDGKRGGPNVQDWKTKSLWKFQLGRQPYRAALLGQTLEKRVRFRLNRLDI